MPALKNRRQTPAKVPLWQKMHAQKRDASKGVAWRKWVMGFIALFVLVSAFYSYRAIASGAWEEHENLNLLVGREGKALALVSVSQKGSVLVFYLDPQVMVESVYGYGDYKVGSLLKLGSLEKLGSQLLTKTVQKQFGMKIHDYIAFEVPSQKEIDTAFLKKLIRPMAFSLLGKPLGVTDLAKYARVVSELRPDQVEVIPVHESRLSYSESLPDASLIYKIDLARLDGFIQDHIREMSFSEEKTSIAIVNTTAYTGLASSLSRILLNSGIDVVSLGENQDHLQKSVIRTSILDKNNNTLQFLQSLFPFEVSQGETAEYRAEIVILLGEDYYQFLSQKPKQ